MIPKSLRLKCPNRSKRTTQVLEKYRFDLLIATKNDAKHRFFKARETAARIEQDLENTLEPEDMEKIKRVTEKSQEAMFLRARERLINKFFDNKVLVNREVEVQ